MRPDEWKTRAACKGIHPPNYEEIFFLEVGESPEPAIAICDTCPVKEACLKFALDGKEVYGVWGGRLFKR